MSPDLNWGDALEAHPEWFKRDKPGNPITAAEDTRLYQTCMFTSLHDRAHPRYHARGQRSLPIDGIFTNAWPPIGRMPNATATRARIYLTLTRPPTGTRFNERVSVSMEDVGWNCEGEEAGQSVFWKYGGAIESGPDMTSLDGVAYWYNCDNQGRGGDDTPIWGCTLQGRVCNAIMSGHTATNVTASYDTGDPRWRNLHKSTEEAQMWMNETVASGMVPWYHFIGGEKGLGGDRRWQQPGYEYFNWLAKCDAHLTNNASIADIAVVMGQRTQRFYRSKEMGDPMWNIHGIYYALIEGRFFSISS